jgi:hypothetical protein
MSDREAFDVRLEAIGRQLEAVSDDLAALMSIRSKIKQLITSPPRSAVVTVAMLSSATVLAGLSDRPS